VREKRREGQAKKTRRDKRGNSPSPFLFFFASDAREITLIDTYTYAYRMKLSRGHDVFR